MMTFGYIREATQAHIDLDEQETQAMHLQERYHIFANEAMQAICAIKPKYDYFKCKIVSNYIPLIRLTDNTYRQATDSELNWQLHNMVKPDFADEVTTKLWYTNQNIYLINTPIAMPEEFISFAVKQAWAFILSGQFTSENFVLGVKPERKIVRVPITKDMIVYTGRNTITGLQEGEYWIPYKAIWYKFKSGIQDNEVLDMPIDILLTIPLYVAAQCLQVDYGQKATVKRREFETALARCTTTDFLETPIILGTKW